MPLWDWSAAALHARFAAGDVSALDICQAFIDRIARTNTTLNAFLTIDADRALGRAAALDREVDRRALGPLAGVPIAIKDTLCIEGMATTAGSRMLAGFIPPYSATAVQRLEAAGAVVIGKTNCDEFAMGSSNEHSAFGAVRNPWALDRTPGGSSGGSAAAVAARLAPAALGSDTGGSVRQPAGFCGVVGVRPTYGRVSRYGLVAFASSLDQIGPIAHNVLDAALVLRVMAGYDARDATSAQDAVPDYPAALTGDIRGCRIGVPSALVHTGVDEPVRTCFAQALEVLAARGATLIDIAWPHASMAVPVYYVIATAEASSNLARYDGVRYGYRTSGSPVLREMYERSRDEGFGAEVKRRMILGTFVLSAGYHDALYVKAQQARALITHEIETALEHCDAVALPTSPTAAFPLGDRLADPLQMYMADVFTVGASMAGLPALSVPCGFVDPRLPVGLQLVGRRFDEATILRIAEAYERDRPWGASLPSLPC